MSGSRVISPAETPSVHYPTGILASIVSTNRRIMVDVDLDKALLGDTALVQSCARMMSAAWIEQQLAETSTAPGTEISETALALRHTIASDLGMGFEIAFKSLMQELPSVDVQRGHNFIKCCWERIPPATQGELDAKVEQLISLRFGDHLRGKVWPFGQYLNHHDAFLNRTADRRYALVKGMDDRTLSAYSEVLFVGRAGRGLAPINKDVLITLGYADGIGALAMYWRTIMEKVQELRWPEGSHPDGGGPYPQRDEARNLILRTADQLIGPLRVMSDEELKKKRARQFEELHPEFRGMPSHLLPGWGKEK